MILEKWDELLTAHLLHFSRGSNFLKAEKSAQRAVMPLWKVVKGAGKTKYIPADEEERAMENSGLVSHSHTAEPGLIKEQSLTSEKKT